MSIQTPIVCAALVKHTPKFAQLHGAAFETGWDEKTISGWIDHGQGFSSSSLTDAERPNGFALALAAGDDAELLTIAVSPDYQREGIGLALLAHLDSQADQLGLERWVLEVACDNEGALALYQACGFEQIGRRRNYYRRRDQAVDALIMSSPVGTIAEKARIRDY